MPFHNHYDFFGKHDYPPSGEDVNQIRSVSLQAHLPAQCASDSTRKLTFHFSVERLTEKASFKSERLARFPSPSSHRWKQGGTALAFRYRLFFAPHSRICGRSPMAMLGNAWRTVYGICLRSAYAKHFRRILRRTKVL